MEIVWYNLYKKCIIVDENALFEREVELSSYYEEFVGKTNCLSLLVFAFFRLCLSRFRDGDNSRFITASNK